MWKRSKKSLVIGKLTFSILALILVVIAFAANVFDAFDLAFRTQSILMAGALVLSIAASIEHAAIPQTLDRDDNPWTRETTDSKVVWGSMVALVMINLVLVAEIVGGLSIFGKVDFEGTVFADVKIILPFQAILVLVHLLVLTTHRDEATERRNRPKLVLVLTVLSAALMVAAFGSLLTVADDIRPDIVTPEEAGVHLLTMSMGLELVALRFRLGLPMAWRVIAKGLPEEQAMSPRALEALQDRTRLTYLAALGFVVLSLAMFLVMSTGNVKIEGVGLSLFMIIFYGGGALVALLFLALRVNQAPGDNEKGRRS